MFSKFNQFFPAVVALMGTTSLASAAINYSLHTTQATFQATAPGQVVSVPVFLTESYDSGDTPYLSSEGILGAGVLITQAPAMGDAPQVFLSTDITSAPAFDGVSVATPGATSAALYESVDFFSPPVQMSPATPSPIDLYLGTFDFTAGATAGAFDYQITTRTPSSQDFVTGTTGTVLDPLIVPGSFQINVQLPEPAIALLAFLPFALRRRSPNR